MSLAAIQKAALVAYFKKAIENVGKSNISPQAKLNWIEVITREGAAEIEAKYPPGTKVGGY